MTPAEPPWLTPDGLRLARRLLLSHELAFGAPLLQGLDPTREPRRTAQELFAADLVVLAHDEAADPRLIYANRAALRLWRRNWRTMVGMPSRLTAAPAQRAARAEALAQARSRRALRGYGGIRLDSRGRRFRIENARLWRLQEESGSACGQAAAFGRWWWLSGETQRT
jgi:hypothetical protein